MVFFMTIVGNSKFVGDQKRSPLLFVAMRC